jgi:prepilin-type N-terminal cleavage/methylation domain-containing protein
MNDRRANGFTLIEMLTVIVIIGVVLAITIPAVTNLMKSGGLNSATREVSNTLSLARQLAITKRVFARVVFPYSQTGSQPDMWYRTYAVMTNRVNNVATGWSYASRWEYLPVGAVLMNDNTILGIPPRPCLDNLNAEQVAFPTNTTATFGPGNSGTLAYVEFAPTGSAAPLVGGDSVFTLSEGFVSGGTPTPTSKTSAGSLVNLGTISVNRLVGRIQVARP